MTMVAAIAGDHGLTGMGGRGYPHVHLAVYPRHSQIKPSGMT